jgi:hypothetical protein
LINALWMIAAWSLMALDPRIRPDVIVVGTDPILSLVIVLPWRLLRPRVRVAHWCFDLYPEAAIAAGLIDQSSWLNGAIRQVLSWSYARCNLIVDIGICMRRRLDAYGSSARKETIAPWALVEPAEPATADPTERQILFRDARIALLYSGNFGQAHSWQGIPELAEALYQRGGKIVFSVRGNAVEALRKAMQESHAAVDFAPFASDEVLQTRLGSADVHIVSLREEWTGTVVPSKFFGALAIGRPVLFLGSPDSAIARWIEEFQVGWVLTRENLSMVVRDIVLSLQPATKIQFFTHCHKIYRKNFCRERALDRWSQLLVAQQIPSILGMK